MRVRHVRRESDCLDSWLKEGHTYTVLEIYVDSRGINYRLISEESATPALHSSLLFEPVNSHVPSSWVISVENNGESITMAPRPWLIKGFWEKFFDNDLDALKIFKQESYKITSEEV
jgi:hypothetical protein